MGEIIKLDDGTILPAEINSNFTYQHPHRITKDTPGIDFAGMLNKVFQCVNMGTIANSVKAGKEFIVQIPAAFQDGFGAGDFFMMENSKTGVKWPTLMEIAENGRNSTVTPLPIVEREFIHGNPFRDLTTGYQNLYMQHQIQKLAELMEKTYQAVVRLEQGQKDDREGFIESGREQIILALTEKDEEKQYQALVAGRKSLSDGKNQVYLTMKRRLSEFEPLPKSAFMRYLRQTGNSKYLDQKDEAFYEIQNYYDLYLRATQMQAASYAMVGDHEHAKQVFDLAAKQIAALDFSKLATIAYAHKGDTKARIYNSGMQFVESAKQTCIEQSRQCDCLEFVVSGDYILEVIEDGKSASVQ